mmetsp:Transcript_29657/g.74577  ORF Transcript_29657/g.74577 Transcript_29657/m.74577 type:complete len:258 (+) Transcript_29657:124-897(+)
MIPLRRRLKKRSPSQRQKAQAVSPRWARKRNSQQRKSVPKNRKPRRLSVVLWRRHRRTTDSARRSVESSVSTCRRMPTWSTQQTSSPRDLRRVATPTVTTTSSRRPTTGTTTMMTKTMPTQRAVRRRAASPRRRRRTAQRTMTTKMISSRRPTMVRKSRRSWTILWQRSRTSSAAAMTRTTLQLWVRTRKAWTICGLAMRLSLMSLANCFWPNCVDLRLPNISSRCSTRSFEVFKMSWSQEITRSSRRFATCRRTPF